jgi:hypothetical protein
MFNSFGDETSEEANALYLHIMRLFYVLRAKSTLKPDIITLIIHIRPIWRLASEVLTKCLNLAPVYD